MQTIHSRINSYVVCVCVYDTVSTFSIHTNFAFKHRIEGLEMKAIAVIMLYFCL